MQVKGGVSRQVGSAPGNFITEYKLGKQSFMPFNFIEIGCLTAVCGETYWGGK
ncbi:hypothetical protein JCM16496A_02730 [Bacteroides rodentium JCM 16496]|jgi:hypothetical protein